MKKVILVSIGLALFAWNVPAQAHRAAPRFTSAYSNLTTDCKDFSGQGGSDGYSVCRGPGGYRVRNYFAASAGLYGAELKGEDGGYPIATVALNFDDRKTRLEWRLANGTPFAVIMRVPTYAQPKDGEYFGPVNGEELIVRGLKGFDFESRVNAKTADANIKARQIANESYLRLIKN